MQNIKNLLIFDRSPIEVKVCKSPKVVKAKPEIIINEEESKDEKEMRQKNE